MTPERKAQEGTNADGWSAQYALESELSSAVAEYLKKRSDVLLTRVEAGGEGKKRLTEKGTGDWCGCVYPSGLHLEIELKKKGGVSRPSQIDRCRAVRRMGGMYEVCRSVAEVHAAIEAAKRQAERRVG